MSQNWNLKKAKKHFKGSDLHEQVIEAFTKAGYEVQKEWITDFGNVGGPRGNAIALQKGAMQGRMKLDGSLMDFYNDQMAIKVDINEQKLVIFLEKGIIVPYIRFKKDETTSPTITAHFLPDGILDKMKISLSFPGEIEKELHFECEITPNTSYINAPYIRLEIEEYDEETVLFSKTEINYTKSCWDQFKGKIGFVSTIEYANGHHYWVCSSISSEDLLPKLHEWNEKISLAYQTSDGKALSHVFTFLEAMLRSEKIFKKYPHAMQRRDDVSKAFSELIVKCLECLGKYTDEVLESTSADLGLSDSSIMKHILEYVKKQ